MKRKLYTTVMALAVAILLMLSIIPHHHHGGVWCAVVEVCEADRTCNDQHTHHAGDASQCVEELSFVDSKALNLRTDADYPTLLLLPVIIPDAVRTPEPDLRFAARCRRGVRLIFYHAPGLKAPLALRAPPVA